MTDDMLGDRLNVYDYPFLCLVALFFCSFVAVLNKILVSVLLFFPCSIKPVVNLFLDCTILIIPRL